MLVREPSRSWREKTGVGKMRENEGNQERNKKQEKKTRGGRRERAPRRAGRWRELTGGDARAPGRAARTHMLNCDRHNYFESK